MEMTRAMLKQANLGTEFWGKAMLTAAYLKNQILHTANADGKTPFERMFGRKPDLGNIRAFGSKVFYHNSNPKIGKMDDRGLEGIFVGYGSHTTGYVIWDPKLRKFVLSRSVKFLEKVASTQLEPVVQKNGEAIVIDDIDPSPAVIVENNQVVAHGDGADDLPDLVEHEPARDQPVEPAVIQPPAVEQEPAVDELPVEVQSPRRIDRAAVSDQNIRHDRRERRLPGNWWEAAPRQVPEPPEDANLAVNYAFLAHTVEDLVCIAESGSHEPVTYEEASQQAVWNKAMEEEYNALIKNGTWELVSLPEGRRPIGSKWVYKAKENEKGKVVRYKARLVARGFTQKEGLDFKETYSPVTKLTTIRTMLAVAAVKDYIVEQADISNAYLNAEVEEELYMEQPKGFVQCGPNGEVLVCRLRRSLYGLKQAGRNWNKKIDAWLKEHGFDQSTVDPCLYVLRTNSKSGDYLALAVYVDDLISLTSSRVLRKRVIEEMAESFKLVDAGLAKWLLGTLIRQQDGTVTVSQQKYVETLLDRFGMKDCRPVSTPVLNSAEMSDAGRDVGIEPCNKAEYMSAVGGLIYLSVVSRPDIALAVSRVGQHMANPTQADMVAVKRIFRYLRGTSHYSLVYAREGNTDLVGYSDSDWAGDLATRKSTSGYTFLLGGAAVSWSSKKQQTVALSSTEAEYIALTSAIQEAVYLKSLLADLQLVQDAESVLINVDNQGAIKISKNNITSNRTKHIDIKYHYCREKVQDGTVRLEYIPSEHMVADILTKAVGAVVLGRLVPRITGMTSAAGTMRLREGVEAQPHSYGIPYQRASEKPQNASISDWTKV
jgi:hypothetical protein